MWVLNMDGKNFEMLMETLRIMENNSGNIENAIVHLIDNFEKFLSYEQKKDILKEFVRYEKMKSIKINSEKTHPIMEKESYRQAIENFLLGTTF